MSDLYLLTLVAPDHQFAADIEEALHNRSQHDYSTVESMELSDYSYLIDFGTESTLNEFLENHLNDGGFYILVPFDPNDSSLSWELPDDINRWINRRH